MAYQVDSDYHWQKQEISTQTSTGIKDANSEATGTNEAAATALTSSSWRPVFIEGKTAGKILLVKSWREFKHCKVAF